MSAEGVRGFWKGNLLNLLRTAPFKALNFSSFDTLHRALVACSGVDGNGERFVAGALAGELWVVARCGWEPGWGRRLVRFADTLGEPCVSRLGSVGGMVGKAR